MSSTAAKMAGSRTTMMRMAILTRLRPSAAANHFLKAAPNAPLMEVFENRIIDKDPTRFLRLAFASKQFLRGRKFDDDDDDNEDSVSDSVSDYDDMDFGDEDEFQDDDEEQEEMEGFDGKDK